MQDRTFDRLSRHTAADRSRRGPFDLFSAPGLAALTGRLTAEANVQASKKKKRKNKKRCPSPVDRCAPQVESCTVLLAAQCGGTPSCLDTPACCSFLATCDSAGFFACLVSASSSP